MSHAEGKIQTVMGCIEPSAAGITYAHEHLICNAEALMLKSPPTEFKELCEQKLSANISWWVNHNPYSSFDNAHLFEEKEAVQEELMFFKKNGGGTIVDNTTYGIHPNAQALANLSMYTGVQIVAGTGYYVESSRGHTSDATTEEFYNFMCKDLVNGCEGTGIKAGVIGELGCSWPLLGSEKRVLLAAAQIESEIGAPVIIHPGRNKQSPFDIMRVYLEGGGHADRVVMSHVERTIQDVPELIEFAKIGCYLDYDLFGLENSYYQLDYTVDMPNDGQRIQYIKHLIDAGFEDRITIGHDIHTKHRLMKYGGHGYSHILLHTVPKMLHRGYTQDHVDKILKSNPQRWLTFRVHK